MRKVKGLRSQRGVVLVVCLLLMLVMSIISAGALRSTTLQERMAGNARDTNSAFQAAEAALRAAERILAGPNPGPFTGSHGLFQDCDDSTNSACMPPDWSDMSATGWADVSSFGGGVNRDPQFYIEEMDDIALPPVSLAADTPAAPITMYRITARGFGVSSNAMVVLRSIYRRQE